jgi:hypothetical protein
MEGSVFAKSQRQLQEEADKMARSGPWYYTGTTDVVPESEVIAVEHVRPFKAGKRPHGSRG